MTQFILYCPNHTPPVPPPDEQQINERGYATWAPDQDLCIFQHTSQGDDARITLETTGWGTSVRVPRRWRMGVIEYLYPTNSQETKRNIEQQYRCTTHGNPPIVIRQFAAYLRRLGNLGVFYDRLNIGRNNADGSPGVPWPAHVRENSRYGLRWVYRLKAEFLVPGTHQFWSSQ